MDWLKALTSAARDEDFDSDNWALNWRENWRSAQAIRDAGTAAEDEDGE